MSNCPVLTATEEHAQRLTDAVSYADDQLEQCAGVVSCDTDDNEYQGGTLVNRTVLTFEWRSGPEAKEDLRDKLKQFVDYLA